MKTDHNKEIILKGKTHIFERKYKVNGFMKTINQLEVEIGAGNNQIVPKEDELITYFKVQNMGDLDVKVRFGKNGKEARTIKLGPDEKYNSVSIFFTGKDAQSYGYEMIDYFYRMMHSYYQAQPLKNVSYKNIEDHDYDI